MAQRKRKRANGEGTIVETKSGRIYAVISLPDGKRKWVRAASRTEASQKLKTLTTQRDQGVNLRAGRQTIDVFLSVYLADVVAPAVKPKTYDNYKDLIELCILPELEGELLERLEPQAIQQWYNEARGDFAETTARNALNLLKRALDTAVQWRYLPYNPAAPVKAVRLSRTKPPLLTLAEVSALLEAVAAHRLGLLYLLTARYGTRKGEILGARWAALDWARGELRIDQQIQTIGGKTGPCSVKTSASARTLTLTPDLVARLRLHWERLQVERQHPDWREHGLIFPSEVGTPILPRNLSRHFYAARDRAGLRQDMRFHDLRHFAVTQLLESGVRPEVVAAIAGHSSVSVTLNVYAHVSEEEKRAAAEKMRKVG